MPKLSKMACEYMMAENDSDLIGQNATLKTVPHAELGVNTSNLLFIIPWQYSSIIG